MFGRKPKVLFNRGPAPEWVFCPACYSGDINEVRRDSWNTTYECSRCTCVFEVSKFTEPGDYQDEYGDGYGHDYILWRDCSSPMSVVREIAIKEYPVIERFARDQRIFGWICDYWSDVQWNEHGNECGYSELAEYGGFRDIVNQIFLLLFGGSKGEKSQRNPVLIWFNCPNMNAHLNSNIFDGVADF